MRHQGETKYELIDCSKTVDGIVVASLPNQTTQPIVRVPIEDVFSLASISFGSIRDINSSCLGSSTQTQGVRRRLEEPTEVGNKVNL